MMDSGESVNKECGPQVFVVDSQALPRPPPARTDPQRLSVYLLLSVALLGVFIEAGFIYNLYSRSAVPSDVQRVEYRKAEKESFHTSPQAESNEVLPEKTPQEESKPAAFLRSASPTARGDGVLRWRPNSFPLFIRGLDYKNDSLVFLQEGYYYIFCKISYLENSNFFQHQVMQSTESYNDRPIELMQSSRLLSVSHNSPPTSERGNSYLGGVFHLHKGDRVFVKVNNSSQVHYDTLENFFGAFMI